MESPLARAVAFTQAFGRRQARHVVELPGGYAVLDDEFPASYDHNKVILTAPMPAADAVAMVDRVLNGAGLAHRLAVVDDDGQAAGYLPAFLAAGYQHEVNVVMCHTGAVPDRPADPTIRVEPLGLDALREHTRRTWRASLPQASEAVIDQLVERRVTRLRGADEVTFLGVRDAGGDVVSHADLYLDATQGVAQIEDVLTDPAHTGRGYARAVLVEGLRRARAAGCDLVFLIADADDWPRTWYARLGYTPVGRTHVFARPTPA